LHRRLWTHFLSIATAREDWQVQSLSKKASKLLKLVDDKGEVRNDRTGEFHGEEARELERRLLVSSEEIHTESGSHAKVLMTWSRSPKVRDLHVHLESAPTARMVLDNLLDDLNERCSGKGTLPWRQK
jgi:hypothetical protein